MTLNPCILMNDKIDNFLFNVKTKIGPSSIIHTLLSDPSYIVWPDDQGLLDRYYCQICPKLDEQELHLLQLSVISSFLLSPRKTDDRIKKWMIKNLKTQYLLSGIHLDDACSTFQWQAVPIVSMGEGGSRINFCMLGFNTINKQKSALPRSVWPKWFGDCLDINARQAVHDAFEAVELLSGKQSDWYLFGLFPSVPDIIRDRSLSFPLALTARSMLENLTLYPGCIATGDLKLEQESIEIGKVGGVFQKWRASKDKGYSLFLYPNANALENSLPDEMKSIAVTDFETGWMWATLYSPDRVNALKSFEAALQSPKAFVSMCDTLDVDSLAWCVKSGHVQQYLRKISEDALLIRDLGEKLKQCSKRARGNHVQTSAMAAMFNTPEDIDRIADIDPVTAMLWCSQHVALANHDGDVKGGSVWCEQGMKYRNEALKRTNGRSVFNQFINRCSGISDRHNQYDFRPYLSEEFMAMLNRQIKIHELNDCPSDYGIGSMYGTVAQNFAFCGSDFIDQTKRYISLAQNAFGRGEDPLLRDDWLRQFFYLFFALLDCGRNYYDEAFEALIQYLEIETVKDIPDAVFVFSDRGNHYPLFAIVRALADMPDTFPEKEQKRLIQKALQLTDLIKVELFFGEKATIHPWQLITCNLGRIALRIDNLQLACQAFEKSWILCKNGEETLNVMALLPLSQLYEIGQLGQKQNESCLNVLINIKASCRLNDEHFRKLTDAIGVEQALSMVADRPGLFFPFNYR